MIDINANKRIGDCDQSAPSSSFIAALDVGTSFIRCRVYNQLAELKSHAQDEIKLVYPGPGCVEMDPDFLWAQVQGVIKASIEKAGLLASDISALGISTQRNTFITWDKDSGEHFHGFSTWKDTRASEMCRSWNASWTMKGMHAGSMLVYTFSRKKRFQAGSIYKLRPVMVTLRLMYMIKTIAQLKAKVDQKKVYYGCIETWLLWKLTAGKSYCTEISLASCTGLYDPYVMDWGYNIIGLFGVPFDVLPPIKNTCSDFGETLSEIFGAPIPITAMAGDQQAAMFGCGCFDQGDVKITLSTGTFIDLNTGVTPHTSMEGLVPIVGWLIDEGLSFVASGFSNDTGSVIRWAKSIGLFDDPFESSDMATSVETSAGVYFVPAFSGLQAPVNDDHACTLFLGLKPDTTKCHMVRAILEALSFRVYQVYNVMVQETSYPLKKLRCTGGVAKNSFVCQMIADLINRPIQLLEHDEMSCLGITFLAGLTIGTWKSTKEIVPLIAVSKTFEPNAIRRKSLLEHYDDWLKAVERSLHWYNREQWVV